MVKGLEIYREKKIFITGHTGFKGAWLVKLLSLSGAKIMGYSLAPNTEPNLFSIFEIEKLCKSIIGDIRDKENLTKHILDFKPDFIFHLAAQPIVLASYESPAYTFDVNVIGTANLLEAVKVLNKPNLNTIIITTDKVYENIEKDYAYKETDRLGGYDPYSASKAATEIVVSSFRSSFFNPNSFEKHKNKLVSVRAGNVIGGGDWAKDRLIPDIVRAIINQEELSIRNPNAIRPWQHVFEPLWGYLYVGKLMSEDKLIEGSINFGPYTNDTLKVIDMVNVAIKTWQKGSYNCPELKSTPHEANLLKLSIEKVISLGWTPQWNATKALEKSIEWYKTFYETPNKIEQITIKQIEEYFREG